MRALKRRRDPAPSKIVFRARRLWRSRPVRRMALIWAPLAVLTAIGAWAASQPAIRGAVEAKYAELRYEFRQRPEFAIRRVEIAGASAEVEAQLSAALGPLIGVSSLEVDARAVRELAENLGWVRAARVRMEAPETLYITVAERRPAVLWRMDDMLTLLDKDGEGIDIVGARAEREDLPLIAGRGADTPAAVREALALFAGAGPLTPMIRGLVRVGERRWNVVLQDGPTVLLPEQGALEAIGFLAALESTEQVLRRDLDQVDLRLHDRPTLRLRPDAVETLYKSRSPKAPGEDA